MAKAQDKDAGAVLDEVIAELNRGKPMSRKGVQVLVTRANVVEAVGQLVQGQADLAQRIARLKSLQGALVQVAARLGEG